MAKVIVERPRIDRGYARKGRNISDELLPKQEGIKRPYGWNRKSLNEHLGPLRRFLLSKVGQKWDDVYREISEHLKSTNLVQQHVRDHIKDYVVIKPFKGDDGKLYEFYRRNGRTSIEESRVLMYVDPDTGILTKNIRKVIKKSVYPITFYKLEDEIELHYIDKIWYMFTWDVVPPADETKITNFDLTETVIKHIKYRTDLFDGRRRSSGHYYRNTKHQLNNRELRLYGLTNG